MRKNTVTPTNQIVEMTVTDSKSDEDLQQAIAAEIDTEQHHADMLQVALEVDADFVQS